MTSYLTKHLTKLVAAIVLLITAATLLFTGTYAWFVLSTNPEVGGVQISIGGANTIQVAPDICTLGEDGTETHEAGTFSRTMHLMTEEAESYGYLSSLSGLTPVSTADGIHWYLPVYEDIDKATDPAEPVAWVEETDLSRDNGSYWYLDFWVQSPVSGTKLRVSTDTTQESSDSGTFVLALPQIQAEGASYTLTETASQAAACLRVGFLVEGEDEEGNPTSRFIIYEPNGDLHPADTSLNGTYVTTHPIGESETEGILLTVQQASHWAVAEDGSLLLNGQLEAALIQAKNQDVTLRTAEEARDYLFHSYLEDQLAGQVTTGSFYDSSTETGLAGATKGVWITELTAGKPQRIRMFIWLEGQDIDCTNAAMAETLMINLELAGESSDTN